MANEKVLAINPGSTSTKVAVFEGDKEIFKKNVSHEASELAKFAQVCDQLDYRVETILNILKEQGVTIDDCAAFAGRGGGLNACPGGTYEVNDLMLEHARRGGGNHPATLGPQIAKKFADQYGARAFIVNPPDVDEFSDVARVTGFADVFRASHIHALNQKETAIRVAKDLGTTYEKDNFIVAHIGGGVSITAHEHGKMVDSNDILWGEGPMAPTRAGALPALQFMDMCYSGKYTRDEMYKHLTKSGGFVDHCGTSDALELGEMIKKGDKYAELVYEAFFYQIAKQIGSMAATLKGDVKAIILTGGISHDKSLVAYMQEHVGFIAPIEVRAGEFEMEALAAGAIRVLKGEEQAKVYTGEEPFKNFDHLKK
ncbi:MAG: butyrate kinase [Oscillospiraceae bacterium]|nr:butyrate kinase [Oscillospiraceae bacterium]